MAFHDAFGALGVWVPRSLPADQLTTVAREVERLGYGALWISGGGSSGVFEDVDRVLAVTERITVATGIVNLWVETPESVTAAWHRAEQAHPGRLYVGLGISHAPMVDRLPGASYDKPLARTRAFLDELDALPSPLPPERRLLGALGPKMVQLAAERTLGSHPYLVTVENTAAARESAGESFLAPELGVVLEADLARARDLGRTALELYFGLPNYTNNWLRAGFSEADVTSRSDRLLDSLLALGDVAAVAERVQAHRQAGADHVTLQVLGPQPHSTELLAQLADLA
jgi:probable F420-dependent oxidoreductase